MSFSVPINAGGSLPQFFVRERMDDRSFPWKGFVFVMAHIPLGLAMKEYPEIATIHALTTLIVGARWAIVRDSGRNVAYAAAYISGAEVLWRMTQASVLWEYGKYATAAIMLGWLVRNARLRVPLLPLLYFALLIPATMPTVMQDYFGPPHVRQRLSFQLSGPFALFVGAWFFSKLKFNLPQFERLLLTLVAPTISIAFITLFSTVTTTDLHWSTQSNFITSGGYGPNQVSSALGMGALMCWLFLCKSQAKPIVKALVFLSMLFLTIQSAMTFSRGGLYGATGAALVSAYYLGRDRRSRLRVMCIAAITLVLSIYVVMPALDSITDGKLSARFESTSTTGRAELIQSDLAIFNENIIFGVGVGMSFFRKDGWKDPHTEFTRLLAEHGILGFLALLTLLFAGWRRLWQAETSKAQATVAATIAWSLLFMLDKAMRLVAPAFAFGLAFATLDLESRQLTIRSCDPATSSTPRHFRSTFK